MGSRRATGYTGLIVWTRVRRAQGVAGNDRECLMRAVVHSTKPLDGLRPAWMKKRKSEIRIFLGAATRTGMGIGGDR